MVRPRDTSTPEEKERAAAMDADIIALRRKRVPFEEIGRLMYEKHGRLGGHGVAPGDGTPDKPFGRGYMHERYQAALAAIPKREADAHRAELGELFNQVIDEAYAIAQKEHLAHSNGRVVELGGEPVLDDGPKLAALAEVRKAAVEVMRLYGLAIPVKQEIDLGGAVNYTITGVDMGKLT